MRLPQDFCGAIKAGRPHSRHPPTFHPDSDGTPNFPFDTLTSESSILSANSVVEYDGLYFWAGVDRFLFYNGVVQEVPNTLNLDWFYVNTDTTGINYPQRQKVWATKIPQYGEIWFFYPSGTSEECDRAVIYNLREKKDLVQHQ